MVLNRDYEGIVTDGLVLNVDAGFTPSYPKNSNTWYDVSVNTNNGTLTNGPTFSSDGGGSVVFDGVDDYVTFGTNEIFNFGTSNFTIQYSYKSTYTSVQTMQVIGKTNGGLPSVTYGWLVATATSDVYFAISSVDGSWGGLGTYIVRTNNANVNNGSWHIITIVVDRSVSNISIYKNGVSQTIVPWVGSGGNLTSVGDISNTLDMRIGAESDNQYYFPGRLGFVQLYNKALSASEVLQNYNATKGRFGL
jgi:hypothetical protein